MFRYIYLLHYLLMKTMTSLFFIGLPKPVILLTDGTGELLILPITAVLPGDLDNYLYKSLIHPDQYYQRVYPWLFYTQTGNGRLSHG